MNIIRGLVEVDPATGVDEVIEAYSRSEVDAEIAKLKAELAEARGWKDSAAHFCSGMEYYRSIVDQIGSQFPACFITDSGEKSEEVLRAKVAEVVQAKLAAAHAQIVGLRAMLTGVEWVGLMRTCQFCGNREPYGHSDKCSLQAALAAPAPDMGAWDRLVDVTTIPEVLCDQILKMGRLDWGATANKTEAEHLKDFADTLRITREMFSMGDEPTLHGAYLAGTETVLCHTGTSPNSGTNAQIIVGIWNTIHAALAEVRKMRGQG